MSRGSWFGAWLDRSGWIEVEVGAEQLELSRWGRKRRRESERKEREWLNEAVESVVSKVWLAKRG